MKRKNGKTIIAALLAASMLCAVPTAAHGAQVKPLILGDANSDGAVNIDDATLIQRYAAEELTFNTRQTVASMITGDAINIGDATMIQKYAAEIPTGAAIGEALDEGTDGILLKKEVSDPDKGPGITVPLWFSTKYDGVPFVDTDFVRKTVEEESRKETITSDRSEDGTVVVLTTKNNITVEFDYNAKTITFSDYILFNSRGDTDAPDLLNGIGESANREHEFVKVLPQSRYDSANSFCLQMGYGTIPMLMQDGEIYIPLATVTDFFYPAANPYRIIYNGNRLFRLPWLDSLYNKTTGALTADGKEYFNTGGSGLTEALTRVNYYELCAAMDANYGLKESHKITDFDSYFEQTGLKKELLSGDPVRMDTAVVTLIDRYFADLHSTYISPSPFFDYLKYGSLLDSSLYTASSYAARLSASDRQQQLRQDKNGDLQYYQRVGDTVFITFDAFSVAMFPGSTYYPEPTLNNWTRGDTICLLYNAYKRLKNEDSDVKNIVFDLSCNNGGAVPALLWMLDFIIGKSEVEICYSTTGSLQTVALDFDLNFDSVINENDKSLRELGYNIAVITSGCSFSCGNAAPCYLKYLDPDVLVLGQTSGGGAALIGYGSTAAGSCFRYSSNNVLVTRWNGQVQTVDNGVRPDIYLSNARMYDRTYISQVVDNAFPK